MTSNNIDIVLTNALCCSANKANELSDLLSKGSLCTESKVRELKVLNDLINTLFCYQNKPTSSKFILKIPYSVYVDFTTNVSQTIKNYVFTVNNSTYSFVGDNTTIKFDVLINFLGLALPNNYTMTVDFDSISNIKTNTYVYLNITTSCDIINIKETTYLISSGAITSNFVFIPTGSGNCNPLNCLTEDEFNNSLSKIMSICDICECQLNNLITSNDIVSTDSTGSTGSIGSTHSNK